MNSRQFSYGVFGTLLVITIAWWMTAERPAPAVSRTPSTPLSKPAPILDRDVPVAIAAPPIPEDLPAPKPPVVHSPEAVKDIESVQFMLRDFRTRLGGNPEGTNAEIMKEVMGGNRAQARLGPPEGQKLNDQGELLDRWGTPYFFHQMSRTETEVRSSGPDLTMWTADDIVLK